MFPFELENERQAPVAERARRHRDHPPERRRDRRLRVLGAVLRRGPSPRRCERREGGRRRGNGMRRPTTRSPTPSSPGAWRCSIGSSCAATSGRSTPAAARAGSPPSCGSACPEGRLIAVDGSEAMIDKARERLGDGATYIVADLCRAAARRAGRPGLLDRDLPLDRRPRAALRAGSARPSRRVGAWSRSAAAQGNVAEHAAVIARSRRPAGVLPHLARRCSLWNFAAPRGDRAPAARRRVQRRHAAGSSRSR